MGTESLRLVLRDYYETAAKKVSQARLTCGILVIEK